MTEEEVMEQVRDAIIGRICKVQIHWRSATDGGWKPLYGGATDVRDICNGLMALPEFLIKDPDQGLPKNPYTDYVERGEYEFLELQRCRVYSKAQGDMKENWVKVVKK